MSHRTKPAVFALGVGTCLALLVVGAMLAGVASGGQPFRMTLRPADGHAMVRFIQPDRDLWSPELPVDLPIEKAYAVDLRSRRVEIPGCKVEFLDTTLLPGRFRLRVDRTTFDVMGRGIIVEGTEYDWRPRRR